MYTALNDTLNHLYVEAVAVKQYMSTFPGSLFVMYMNKFRSNGITLVFHLQFTLYFGG